MANYFLGGLIENVGGKATIVGIASFLTVGGCPVDKPQGFANVANYLDCTLSVITPYICTKWPKILIK